MGDVSHILILTETQNPVQNHHKKLEFVVIYKKNPKIMPHLTKRKTFLVIWLNTVTIVAQSVRLLPAHTHDDVHATVVNCIVNDGQVSAIPNRKRYVALHYICAENAGSLHHLFR